MNLYLAFALIFVAFVLGYFVRSNLIDGTLRIDKHQSHWICQFELNSNFDLDKKRRAVFRVDPNAILESRKEQGL